MTKRINVLASWSGPGGGEQSAAKIVRMLREKGWHVNAIPWKSIHPDHREIVNTNFDFENMKNKMEEGIPLLFYGNDNVNEFADKAEGICKKSSGVVIGINFIVGRLPKTKWLFDKLRCVVFQNKEKRDDWKRKEIAESRLEILYGAIDLDQFDGKPTIRNKDLVVLRMSNTDSRKFVTKKHVNDGEKVHCWQKHLVKELDSQFYSALAMAVPNIRFEFMVACNEVENHFRKDPKFKFWKWNEIPVKDFLSRGHVFLYRTSNAWRDQYPRVIAEALASGLPCLVEPRDGPMDRIVYGYNGFHCITINDYINQLKLLEDNESLRLHMSKNCSTFAKEKLDPYKWVDLIENI